MYQYLCGVASVLIVETVALIIAKEWLRKYNRKMNVRAD